MKKYIIFTLFFAVLSATAQVKIGDNPTTVDANALLEMESSSKGMLLPRMTALQRDAISNPSNSMLIYNITEDCLNIFNTTEGKWKSICSDEASGTASYGVDCGTMVLAGSYTTGVALDPDLNYITIKAQVAELGSYNIVANSTGMYFSAAGEFTALGDQDIVLKGQGYPLVSGVNFLTLNINGSLCTSVINVGNGLSTITGCGTVGSLTGSIYANEAINSGAVYQSYTAGPSYTGGNVFGITSSTVNGLRISQPVNGSFTSSGAPIDYFITGTALAPGNSTLNYSINGYACSFTVPVLSGTGLASAVTCSGTLAGTYSVGTPVTGSNTKIVTLTVTQAGTFYIRTNTANGIYFSGSGTAAAAGSLNVTLTASGTPTAVGANNYTVTVSSSTTAFATCSFSVTATLPATVPAFNTLSCSYGPSVSYIKANNTGAGDVFGGEHNYQYRSFSQNGARISADGLTLVAGAMREDGSLTGGAINSTNDNNLAEAGAAYIYMRTSLAANWQFQAKLKPTQLETLDVFGGVVGISTDGNTVVVGSRGEDGSGSGINPTHNNNTSGAGAVYVFTRSGTTWSQQAYIKAPNPGLGDAFGCSLAISGDGNTIAVGTVDEDGDGRGVNKPYNDLRSNSGAVYTYTRSGSTWSFDAYLKSSNSDVDDWFGRAVSLNNDGTTMAVGAGYEDGGNPGINPVVNNSASSSGAVYVFQKNSGSWSQQAYIKAGNVSAGDEFGISVGLDGTGNTLVVGSASEDGNGKGVNPAANESSFNSGAAYIFNRSGSIWTQTAYLKAINNGSGDGFGVSVAISNDGQSVLVGAPWEDSFGASCINQADNNSGTDIGAAYLFNLVSGNWTYSFNFKPNSGQSASDVAGTCVSLDSTGRTIVLGIGYEDGSGSGINPAPDNAAVDAGCVAVYTK